MASTQARGLDLDLTKDGNVFTSAAALTALWVHAGYLTLRIHTKGACVLRVEAVVHYCRVLGYGKSLANLPQMVGRASGHGPTFPEPVALRRQVLLGRGCPRRVLPTHDQGCPAYGRH